MIIKLLGAPLDLNLLKKADGFISLGVVDHTSVVALIRLLTEKMPKPNKIVPK